MPKSQHKSANFFMFYRIYIIIHIITDIGKRGAASLLDKYEKGGANGSAFFTLYIYRIAGYVKHCFAVDLQGIRSIEGYGDIFCRSVLPRSFSFSRAHL